MTTLVAIAEPERERRSEPAAGAMLWSALLHVAVVALLVLMTWLLPPPEQAETPQERTVEVVMVPPPQPTPQPTPQPQQQAAVQPQPAAPLPVERMNFSEQAEVSQESRATDPAQQSQPEAAATEPAAAQRSQDLHLPTAPIEPAPPPPTEVSPQPQPTPQAAPPQAAQPRPVQPQPAPTPEAAPPTNHFQINPRSIRTFEPPPEISEPQVAALPPPQPARPAPPAPQARATFPQSQPPRPQTTQPPGELHEVDLFGRGRLPPRQSAAPARSSAVAGSRDTSSEAAYILRQVLRAWTVDYRNQRYRDVVLSFRMPLQADGTLGYPWGRNDPWLPNVLIANYEQFLRPGMEPERRLLESFAYAVKMAQPYMVPPTPGPYPRIVNISFRLGDL